MMRQIIRDTLWIGNAFEARDVKLILDNGITAVVDLAIEERAEVLPRELIYCRFPLARRRRLKLPAHRTWAI